MGNRAAPAHLTVQWAVDLTAEVTGSTESWRPVTATAWPVCNRGGAE